MIIYHFHHVQFQLNFNLQGTNNPDYGDLAVIAKPYSNPIQYGLNNANEVSYGSLETFLHIHPPQIGLDHQQSCTD